MKQFDFELNKSSNKRQWILYEWGDHCVTTFVYNGIDHFIVIVLLLAKNLHFD